MSEADDNRASERRGIECNGGIESSCIHEEISKHEPAFCVGVDDLDGLAIGCANDIARLYCGSRRHVGRRTDDTNDVDRQLESTNCFHRAHHTACAGHVELHPLHFCSGLDRDTTRVETESLANQDYRLLTDGTTPMFERDESRFFGRSLRNAQE